MSSECGRECSEMHTYQPGCVMYRLYAPQTKGAWEAGKRGVIIEAPAGLHIPFRDDEAVSDE